MRQQYAVSSRHYAETAAAAGTPQRRRVLFLPAACRPLPTHRRGFTFTEVMFAVILLGIGFIMLAGMFPVAIQQTQTNVEESTASTVVQAAARYLGESMTLDDMPVTGDFTVTPPIYPRFLRVSQRFDKVLFTTYPHIDTDNALWQKCRGGFILPQDPRFAWTALYKRNPGDN